MAQPNEHECMITFILVVLGILTLFWFMDPKLKSLNEAFAESLENELEEELVNLEGDVISPASAAFHNPVTGEIQDGPEWQVENAQGEPVIQRGDVPHNYYLLQDGADGQYMAHNGIFSPACCSAQFMTEGVKAGLGRDAFLEANAAHFAPNNLMGQSIVGGSGCLCMPKYQQAFYSASGNNRENCSESSA